jgi:hypothetical protein
MNTRGAAWLAGSACGLTLVMIVCTVVLSILNRSEVDQSFFVFILLSCVAVGGLVASRRPRNPIGWFFVVSAVFLALQSLTLEYATYGLITDPGSLPATEAMAWVAAWMWVPGVALLLTFVPLYFPDGCLVSPRWRWVVRAGLFVYAGCVVSLQYAFRTLAGEGSQLAIVASTLAIAALSTPYDAAYRSS